MQAKYLLLLRAALAEILLLHILYAPTAVAWSRAWLWALLAGYAAAALAIHRGASRSRVVRRWLPASFLLDVAVTTAALAGTADVGSDLYIAYFLVILAACLQDNLGYSFIIGSVSCVVYGAVSFPGRDWLEQPWYLLHCSLLLLTAFFGSYAASTAKRVEADLEERFEQKVAWMQRLSWVGQAISAVLHEVRTPLNTVLLSAEYARRRVAAGDKEEAAQQLDVIEKESRRAIEIVSNYLEFAKPSDLTLTPLKLQSPLREALEAIKPWCRDKDIAVEAALEQDVIIQGSRRHLIQVFTNLLTNAVEAMPLGGRLEITVARTKGAARVAIRDSGVGIPAEMSDRLFRPFQTSKGDYEGHGLGLSIARWIVQKHAGSMLVTSPGQGKGTEVVVELPLGRAS